jgi:hypothetical protein
MRRLLLLSLLTLFTNPTYAVDESPPQVEVLPEVPDLPMPVESGEEMEPDISIIRKGDKVIQEYRRSGRVYMIKVIPDIGPPYYFIDANNDGKLDAQKYDQDKGAQVNMWKILEWD